MRKRKKSTEAQKKARREAEFLKGHDPAEASAWQYSQLASLGIEIDDGLPRYKAEAMIRLLRKRELSIEDVASMHLTYLSEQAMYAAESDRKEVVIHTAWMLVPASQKQIGLMQYKGLRTDDVRCKRDAGLRLDAELSPEKFVEERNKDFQRARNHADLDLIALDLKYVAGVLPQRHFAALAKVGRERRQQIGLPGGIPQ